MIWSTACLVGCVFSLVAFVLWVLCSLSNLYNFDHYWSYSCLVHIDLGHCILLEVK